MSGSPLRIALKEWAIVCELLAAGRCCLLLRKGGVHEDAGPGRFRLDHARFALFPATEHERLDWIKPRFRTRTAPLPPRPETVSIDAYADVVRVWEIPGRRAFDALDDLHPWATPQIDMRFDYKPDRPIYLVALRTYRLPAPRTVRYSDAYLGCRSWVELAEGDAIPIEGAHPVMRERELEGVVARVDAAFA